MYILVIALHIIACLILITAILLQSGRGGGLSGLFGGGSSQTIFGARASTFLTRTTTAAAVVFLLTCIGLTVFSGRRGKSLLEGTTPLSEESKAQPLSEPIPEEITEEKPQTSETQPQLPQE